jgi:uracil DNA glycosylase
MSKYNEIFGEDWAKVLKPFLASEDFKKIGDHLVDLKKKGKEIIPDFKKVFNNFKASPFNDVMAVWIMKLPTKGPDSEKMCCRIVDEIHKQVGGTKTIWNSPNVLLLPLNPTTTDQGEDHSELWRPFVLAVLDALKSKPVVYLLVGKEAQDFDKYIDVLSNDYYYVEHPMNAVIKNREWKTNDVFNKVNTVTNLIHNKKVYGSPSK